jgi:3-polyprenyl-4-hydroxybenzoate decarboxylase
MYVSLGHDEFDIAGGLMNEPLRLLRCESVNLGVPADAEIVLEGTLHADERIEEGLVSEFHGFYENYGQGHAIHINAVMHRSKPIYQTILPGYAAEHILLGAIAARMRGEEDIMIIPGMKSDRCDPQQKNMTVTKVGIVAATRLDGEESSRKLEYARPRKDVLEKIKRDLANYLGK